MSNPDSRKATSVDPSNDGVGYKRPPRHTQFKPGQSGNPAGRPKRLSKSANEMLEDALTEKVTVRVGRREIRMTKLEALYQTLVQKALSGDKQSLKMLLSAIKDLGSGKSDQDEDDVVMMPNFPPRAKTYEEWLATCQGTKSIRENSDDNSADS